MASTDIPPSSSTVEVSILDSSTRINGLLTNLLFTNPIPGFDKIDDMPSWAFLISHPSGIKILFDGGAQVDWEIKGPPTVRQEIEEYGWIVTVQKGIDQILHDGGTKVNQISGMVWSHMHWDHVADLTRFPTEMPLVVGPGFREEFFPGWPEDEESTLDSKAWSNGRPLIELNSLSPLKTTSNIPQPHNHLPPNPTLREYLEQAPTLTIADLPAIDVFSDGSLYLLSTPGHTSAHLCALARTGPSSPQSASEFILLAGDAFDNGGEIRPSEHIHLPNHLVRAFSSTSAGQALLSRTQGSTSDTSNQAYSHPFLVPEADNIPQAKNSLCGIMHLDARSDVLTLCAHEKYHLFEREGDADSNSSGMPFFPARLNGWRHAGQDGLDDEGQKGRDLRERLFWWFLRDYGVALPKAFVKR